MRALERPAKRGYSLNRHPVFLAHEATHQLLGVLVFGDGTIIRSLILRRVIAAEDFPLPLAVVQVAALALDQHAAHEPLAAKVDGDMANVAIGPLGVVKAVVGVVEHAAGYAESCEPGRNVARQAMTAESPHGPWKQPDEEDETGEDR